MNLVKEVDTAESLPSTIGRLSACMSAEYFPSGDHVALKRIAPGAPLPLAYYRLWLLHLNMDPPDPDEAWSVLVWGLALMGQGAHNPKRGFGKALAEAKFSEYRLEQLLSAPEDIRLDLLRRSIRFLAVNGQGFNWLDVALLVLTRDAEKREQLHRKIAADFYRNMPKDH